MDEAVEALAVVPEQFAAAAEALFGDRLPVAERYAQMLVGDGGVRGLIGPREAPRIWERHLLNCAAVAELIPSGSTVTDVGSGAGLPGIVLAVARPDLRVTLVEPLARRTAFLLEALDALGLDHATVVRGRAEECVAQVATAPIVTARAVAPLDRLAAWCLPLTQVGGRLLAFKGASAAAELTEHAAVLDRLGAGASTVLMCGGAVLPEPTTVVEIVRAREIGTAKTGRAGRGRSTR